MAKAEAFNTGELASALDDLDLDLPNLPVDDDDGPKTIKDLPNDVLVSIFELINDLTYVRRTVPLVCRAWAELYRTRAASPLHETLVLDFQEELESAMADLHASRVIEWVGRRAGWVRKLYFKRGALRESFEEFTEEDLGALVAAAGPSLTDVVVEEDVTHLDPVFFWRALRASVIPDGQLRSLVVKGNFAADVSDDDVEPLGQLAGTLEELVLLTTHANPVSFGGIEYGLTRLPESVCALTELRCLTLHDHPRITAIPAQISALKKLKELTLGSGLSSLPKELAELSRLEKLDLSWNENLGDAPQDAAFPAELGRRMRSLRDLRLAGCGLRAVPAVFVGRLKSLEVLDLSCNGGGAPQDDDDVFDFHTSEVEDDEEDEGWEEEWNAFPAELGRLQSLRELKLAFCRLCAVPAFVSELESLDALDLSHNKNLRRTAETQDEAAFPAGLGRLKSLRFLDLSWCRLPTVPAFVSELEALACLELMHNDLRTVPAFVGELEALEVLDLSWNMELGSANQEEAFPAELGRRMRSFLRVLKLEMCGLRAVPAFLGELEALECLDISRNNGVQIGATTLDFLVRGCPRLREVRLPLPKTQESQAHIKAFSAKLRLRNPYSRVSWR